MKSIDEYPDLLKVYHLTEILKSCENTVYKMLRKTQVFPVIKFGGKYLIPKKPFWEALMAGEIN